MGCGGSKASATAVVHIAAKGGDSIGAATAAAEVARENSRQENPYAFEAGEVQAAHALFAPDDGHIHPGEPAEDDVGIPLADATGADMGVAGKAPDKAAASSLRSSINERYGVIDDAVVKSVRPLAATLARLLRANGPYGLGAGGNG
jgi:hypothetical protein